MCTGQSNMGISLSGVYSRRGRGAALVSWDGSVSDGHAEIANASAFPLLRLAVQASVSLHEPTLHAQLAAAPSDAIPPKPASPATWFRPSPANVGPFSAVCWMFGRRLQVHLGVPVGLIQNQVGGTATELWSSAEALSKCDQNRNATNINPSCEMLPSAAKPPNIRENSTYSDLTTWTI